MINVILADDHQMFIDGMRLLIDQKEDIQIVGEANDGDTVLELLANASQPVDVVVLDIEMPGTNGIEATKIIRSTYEKTKVLILSMYHKKEFIIQLMRNGASGYILKNKSKEELIMAIYNVASGRTHYGLEIMEKAVAVSPNEEEEKVELTEREIEVLQKIAEGYITKEIADQLNISETTVTTHRRNIMAKLEVPNLAHLVRYAIKHEYVVL